MRIRDAFRWVWNQVTRPISGVRDPEGWLVKWVNGDRTSDSGVTVNGRTIYSYAPYYNPVMRVAGQIASPDIELKQQVGDEIRTVARYGDPVLELLNLSPNPVQAAQDFRETAIAAAITWGNGRWAIRRDSPQFGRPVEFLFLPPEATTTYKVTYPNGSWDLVHEYTDDITGQNVPVFDRDTIHIKGLSDNGYIGMSLIELANNAIGGGLAGEKFVNRSYANNATPGVILEVPVGQLRRQADVDQFREEFIDRHGGLNNPAKVALLRHGITAKTLTMSGRDSQIIEQRRLSREDAALFVNVSDLLGIDDSVAYNSVAQKANAEYRRCYLRWFKKVEQQLDKKLLTDTQRRAGFFFKHNVSQLLAGSRREHLETLKVGREAGIIGQQEARRELGLGPMDPSDSYDNPNTSSSSSTATTGEGSPGNLAENLARFLESEVRGLLSLATKSPTRFVDGLDAFYLARACKLTELVRSHGGRAEVADEWIRTSRRDLLEMTGQVQPTQLVPAIRVLGERWARDRAEAIARRIERLPYHAHD